jgi:hypothetical protein
MRGFIGERDLNESRPNRVCENRDGEGLRFRHVAKRDSDDECGEQRTNEACSNRVSRIRAIGSLRIPERRDDRSTRSVTLPWRGRVDANAVSVGVG